MCQSDFPVFNNHSKNSCGAAGLAEVLKSLSYSPSLKELMLTGLSISGSMTSGSLPTSLGKMFELSVTLEKVEQLVNS